LWCNDHAPQEEVSAGEDGSAAALALALLCCSRGDLCADLLQRDNRLVTEGTDVTYLPAGICIFALHQSFGDGLGTLVDWILARPPQPFGKERVKMWGQKQLS